MNRVPAPPERAANEHRGFHTLARFGPALLGFGTLAGFIVLMQALIYFGVLNQFIVPYPTDIARLRTRDR